MMVLRVLWRLHLLHPITLAECEERKEAVSLTMKREVTSAIDTATPPMYGTGSGCCFRSPG